MLNELAEEIHQIGVEHGFWDTTEVQINGTGAGVRIERNFAEVLALIHSEVSEALEAWRDGMPINVSFSQHKDGTVCRDDEMCGSELGTSDPTKPIGVPSELADIIIRVLDVCGKEKIDIEQAVRLKVNYNKTRPYLHGRKRA
jgi:NTP pyrophosphatase (non-canonical NTP hydrolase)